MMFMALYVILFFFFFCLFDHIRQYWISNAWSCGLRKINCNSHVHDNSVVKLLLVFIICNTGRPLAISGKHDLINSICPFMNFYFQIYLYYRKVHTGSNNSSVTSWEPLCRVDWFYEYGWCYPSGIMDTMCWSKTAYSKCLICTPFICNCHFGLLVAHTCS